MHTGNIEFSLKKRDGGMMHAVLTATKKELREFIRDRSCTTHYKGRTKIMYVRGANAARVIEEAHRAYPHKHISLEVETRTYAQIFKAEHPEDKK